MNSKFYRAQARAALDGKLGKIAPAILIFLVINYAVNAPGLFIQNNPILHLIERTAFLILSILVLEVMQFSVSVISLKALHNIEIRTEDIFIGFRYFNTVVCKTLLEVFYIFLGLLLLIVPGIMMSYSYAMSDFILADNPNITASQAIERSEQMMKGHRFELFTLDFSFIGWFILNFLTLGILNVYTFPYQRTAHAVFYERLKAEMYGGIPERDCNEEQEHPSYDYNQSPNYPDGFEPAQSEVFPTKDTNEE